MFSFVSQTVTKVSADCPFTIKQTYLSVLDELERAFEGGALARDPCHRFKEVLLLVSIPSSAGSNKFIYHVTE